MSLPRYLGTFAEFLNSSGILGFAGGGTGVTSTPANGEVLIGNGSGYSKATLTQGTGITITNGAGSITIASSGGSAGNFLNALYSTPGTYTWTAPSTTTSVRVTVIAGGSGSYGTTFSGAGGGAAVGVYTVVPGTGYTVTVGAASDGVSTGTSNSGGSSSFGSFLSATGGGGASSSAAGTAGAGTGGTLLNSVGSGAATTSSVLQYFRLATSTGGSATGSVTARNWSPTYSTTRSSEAGGGGSTSTGPNGGVSGIVFIEYVG